MIFPMQHILKHETFLDDIIMACHGCGQPSLSSLMITRGPRSDAMDADARVQTEAAQVSEVAERRITTLKQLC